ncbi:MAG: hypothetical protein ACF788_06420, partial [Novipirellula sp. JB048]
MKTNFRGLAFTAMLLSASQVSVAQQRVSSVGDLPGYDEDAYFADESTYQQQVSGAAAISQPTPDDGAIAAASGPLQAAPSQNEVAVPPGYAAVGAEELQPVAFLDGHRVRNLQQRRRQMGRPMV